MQTEEPSLLILTNSEFVLVDTDLLPELSQSRWHPTVRGYAQSGKGELLHRHINRTPKGLKTDHANRCIWDCRRDNLRTATVSQNSQNSQKPRSAQTSQFKGVYFDREKNRWRAKIKVDGKTINLAYFENERQAAECYDAAAKKHFGEFALTNFTR